MEQRTLRIGDRIIYCYDDGSVEFLSDSTRHEKHSLRRTFGCDDNAGYKKICLSVNGKMTTLKVHRLIALAFHPNPEGLPEVDHINRNKADNRPCNLRWVDHKANNDNKTSVEQSISKYGVRACEDRKAYDKTRSQLRLTMIKPDGKYTTTGALSSEVYNMLKPLSQKERYFKHQELLSKEVI